VPSIRPVRVRRANAGDVDAICRICSAGWRDTYRDLLAGEDVGRVIASYYSRERVGAEVQAPNGWDGWWVAEDGAGDVVAVGGGMTSGDRGEVLVLYADPARRRQGGGSAVLEAITGEQRAGGAREQWVSVVPGNRLGIAFYERHGFAPAGERPQSIGPPSELYRREL
jgi:GNAT superfamily N-acetyltransferase